MKVSKKAIIGIIKLVIFLAILFTLIYVMLSIYTKPKTPATTEKVQEVLVALGYEPQDITEQFVKQDSNINHCTAIQKDDIRFEFYDFNNRSSAINVYGTAHSLIIRTKMVLSGVETDTRMANYSIYTLESTGEYSVAIYVGTTAVYAYSKAENKYEINKILQSINYLK